MPISHACANCGASLTRVPALIDPHYGLPLVVCPVCAAACVRRRHPIQQGWRRFIRVLLGIRALLVNLAGVVLSVGFVFGLSVGMSVTLHESSLTPFGVLGALAIGDWERFESLGEWREQEGNLLGAIWLGAVVLSGAWLTAALPHWRRRWMWLSWLGLVLTTLVITFALISFHEWLDYRGDLDTSDLAETAAIGPFQMIVLAMVIAPVGMPLGRLVRRGLDARAAGVFGRRRRRIRRRRQNA